MRSAAMLAALTLLIAAVLTACPSAAAAAPCFGTYTIGVGGYEVTGPQNSFAFPTVVQRVGYNTYDPVGGLNELDRLVREHRAHCPGDHVKMIGHSEGAAIVHAWVTANQTFPNANAILIADPKRVAGPGGPGLSALGGPLGYPLAGVDDWFGSFPVLSVCNRDDGVCNIYAGAVGYVSGRHAAYDFDVNHYSNDARGVWFF